jgi:hypothetical protein
MVFMMPLSVVVNTLFKINNMIMFTWARISGAGQNLHERRVKKVHPSPPTHPTLPNLFRYQLALAISVTPSNGVFLGIFPPRG